MSTDPTVTGGGSTGMPVVESWTDTSEAASQRIVLQKPASVGVGDYLLILVANDNTTADLSWDNNTYKPTGFDSLLIIGNTDSDVHIGVFSRVADGSEGDTIGVPTSWTGGDYVGWYIRMTNVVAVDSIGVPVTGNSAANVDVAGVLTQNDSCLVFVFAAEDDSSYNFTYTGTGWTQSATRQANTNAFTTSATWGTKAVLAVGESDTVNIATVTGQVDTWAAIQFALKGVTP